MTIMTKIIMQNTIIQWGGYKNYRKFEPILNKYKYHFHHQILDHIFDNQKVTSQHPDRVEIFSDFLDFHLDFWTNEKWQLFNELESKL